MAEIAGVDILSAEIYMIRRIRAHDGKCVANYDLGFHIASL
jgi:hypothetical protein